MVCQDCLFLFQAKYPLEGAPVKWNRKIAKLKAGAASCQLCALLFEWTLQLGESTEFFKQSKSSFPDKDVMHYGARVGTSCCDNSLISILTAMSLRSRRFKQDGTDYSFISDDLINFAYGKTLHL
jgi:hypothetical protein